MELAAFKQRILDSVPAIIALEIMQRDDTHIVRGKISTEKGPKVFSVEYLRGLTREYADDIVDVLTTELR